MDRINSYQRAETLGRIVNSFSQRDLIFLFLYF